MRGDTRQLLQWGGGRWWNQNTNLGPNTLRAQAATSECPCGAAQKIMHACTCAEVQRPPPDTPTDTPRHTCAPACTGQAILQAVNDGGNLGSTRRAGWVGSTTSWAVPQVRRSAAHCVGCTATQAPWRPVAACSSQPTPAAAHTSVTQGNQVFNQAEWAAGPWGRRR